MTRKRYKLRTGMPLKPFYNLLGKVNAEAWNGYAAGTVLMRHVEFWAGSGGGPNVLLFTVDIANNATEGCRFFATNESASFAVVEPAQEMATITKGRN